MARTLDLPKRGALPRKRSSLSKDVRNASSGIEGKKVATTSSRLGAVADEDGLPSQPLNKAEKRALKRAELMQSVGAPVSQTQARLASLPPYLLSKSSLRRQKRRQREQLAGNADGMQDVATAVEEVQMEQVEAEREAERVGKVGAPEKRKVQLGEEEGLGEGAGAGGSKPAISAKKRKQVLAAELGRQQHIFADPAFSKSPFAALRQHARNAMAFAQEPPAG
ncbi:unnamed protein product [Tilletia controversa]|uniref:Ribosome biogenesis protein SLX9 n=3 Tax=Tilletia TaxID=13289 RepID=A0A8X7MWU8_9BASI|nr:hypothetical protein CF336_g2263 [Tilletia laevis]KAE8202455.1 hypothetical protein CF328_g2203 [Tilletia controversa]KAE8263212.1 hypothetical protein A4X03_0g1852 [Tilletia caries]KAE8208381.1 hypothetical protein CF335_g452 [Tilletia laevis]KAE8251315.1 hypothetical protein A4X06_0g2735 [Tilletia controversa]